MASGTPGAGDRGRAGHPHGVPIPPQTRAVSLLSSPDTLLAPSPGPASPAHPVPQVGGRGLPVQFREGLEPAAQISVQQLCLCPQRVRNHLPVTAQQRPALHVHVLRAHGKGTEVNSQGTLAGGSSPLLEVPPTWAGSPGPHTSWRVSAEPWQRSVAPKQKQRVQPLGLAASREKVPRRHWSHRGPCTFSWGRAGRTGQSAACCIPARPGALSAPAMG